MNSLLDFHMVSWLKKECQRAARVDNSVQALKRLHSDFQWPFPLLLSSVLANINNADPAKSVDDVRKSSNNSSVPSQSVSLISSHIFMVLLFAYSRYILDNFSLRYCSVDKK